MVRISILLLLVVPLAAACATTPPDAKKYLHEGLWELEGDAALTFTSDDNLDSTHFNVNTVVSYSVNDQLQIGPLVLVDLDHQDFDDVDLTIDRDMVGVGPNVRYNFPLENNPLIPFIEGAVGLVYANVDVDTGPGSNSEDDVGLFAQIGVGTRFLMSESASINLALRYRYVDLDSDLGGSQDQFGVFAGLALTF
jgi:hypothetical protein